MSVSRVGAWLGHFAVVLLAVAHVAGALAAPGTASEASAAGIYSCTDDKGRKLTSDRPIPECNGREQRVLNRDGSLRSVKPPPLTADERAEREAAERRQTQQKSAQNDAVRRDRNLVSRYPDEPSHRRAREAALDTVRAAIKATERRVADLAAERKPLMDEAEFYKGKALPVRLRQRIDANDAALDAQKSSAQNQAIEVDRISAIYNAELARLQRLWAGAPLGSLGPAAASAEIKPPTSTATSH